MRICRSPFQSSYLKNKKLFLSFLFHLWNLHPLLNIFKKNKIVIGNDFPKLTTVQGLVTPLTIQRCLKTSFESQRVQPFQTLVKCSWALLPYFFVTLRKNDLENISLIEVWSHRVVCKHMDCRLQRSCYRLWEFPVPYSNPVILKTKKICSEFYSIYGISITFSTFSKKTRLSQVMYFRN